MMMNRSSIAISLLCALVFAATVFAAFVAPNASRIGADEGATYHTASEAEEAAAVAREALTRLPAEGRLGEIKNERLRRAVQLAYRAVVELANNHDSAKVAALYYKFEQAYAGVRRETARGGFKNCLDNCQTGDGQPCETICRSADRKFCGCTIIVFGCLVAECIF